MGSAVKKLDFRGGKRLAPRRKQLFGGNFARVFYRTESRRAVALAVAHEGGQAAHRPRARVVPQGGNPVAERVFLALDVIGGKAAAGEIRFSEQAREQADEPGGQAVGIGDAGLVDAVREKADAEVFALFAHSGLDTRAVKLVERRAERVQIGIFGGSAAQNLRQTGAERGVLSAERQQQHRTQHRAFEAGRCHAGQRDALAQGPSGHLLHNFPRFRKIIFIREYYT